MMGAGLTRPTGAFLSVNEADKDLRFYPRKLNRLGFQLIATLGTASRLRELLTVENVFKVNEA